ncbi:LLM class flavin-dependent oxidoreductase [Agrobacterium vitis]|uniref:LLM class flavin-dependent oxidoreductase n=1 Tax=Agrobacterium vitis TaxID=373 RepID=UPI0015DA8FBC|nr:LLM class flavin-dependent oxidoreductase [Agrobacterium vitis]MCF1455609.1 LLM class flavin-dependent oxidoreductase [Agrobacterium vitis]BCH56724.1 monooxygenase [Agrobacterium vitis]
MTIAIDHIGFLTPGNYPPANPLAGLEATLQLFEHGEQLGFNSAWVRHRHLEPGISSAAVFLAAAGQRTRHIEIGTAVIPLGYESPFRLAEDLALADVLSSGRLNIGISVGLPAHIELIGSRVFDGDWTKYDFSYNRALRLIDNLRSDYLGSKETRLTTPFGPQRPRLQPSAKGLIDRIWYGGGSIASAKWAGSNGLNLLIGNVISGEDTDDFYVAQARQLSLYRAAGCAASRVALGRVIVPLDSASATTRRKYLDFAKARLERTLHPNGPNRTLYPRDLVGNSDDIVNWLHADPILKEVSELRLELPYEFEQNEYYQILHDFVTKIAPRLGWHAQDFATRDEQSGGKLISAHQKKTKDYQAVQVSATASEFRFHPRPDRRPL